MPYDDHDFYEPAEDAHLEQAYEDRFGVNEVDMDINTMDDYLSDLDPDDPDNADFFPETGDE